jgi:hypothetical protein
MPAHDALRAIQSVKPLILAGKIRPLSKNQTSGIAKSCIPGPWTISTTGLVRAAQADLEKYGGAEKALLHDPFDHYKARRRDMGAHPLLEISCDRGSSPRPSPSPLPASKERESLRRSSQFLLVEGGKRLIEQNGVGEGARCSVPGFPT